MIFMDVNSIKVTLGKKNAGYQGYFSADRRTERVGMKKQMLRVRQRRSE